MTTNEALVERVARAIHEALSRADVMAYLDMPEETPNIAARAAIAALTPPAAEGEELATGVALYAVAKSVLTEGEKQFGLTTKDGQRVEVIARLAHAAPKVAGVEEAALRHIADADPGAQSDQSLAHEMAAVARQALAAAPSAPGSGEG